MNYQRHYDRLIERARVRELCGYSERHHVLPRCLGGANEVCNLVRLTPEEHYVAHQLLVKIHPDNGSLLWAAKQMSRNRPGRQNKLYGWLRRKFSVMNSRHMKGLWKDQGYLGKMATRSELARGNLGWQPNKTERRQCADKQSARWLNGEYRDGIIAARKSAAYADAQRTKGKNSLVAHAKTSMPAIEYKAWLAKRGDAVRRGRAAAKIRRAAAE